MHKTHTPIYVHIHRSFQVDVPHRDEKPFNWAQIQSPEPVNGQPENKREQMLNINSLTAKRVKN